MKIAIDVTWLKPGKSGGVESMFRNLLEGLVNNKDENIYYLLLAQDNYHTFLEYEKNQKVKLIKCNTKAENVKAHILWQNLFQYRVLKKYNLKNCFFPVYERPIFKNKKIKTITTICDILAFHYPNYFSKLENMWFKLGWKAAIKQSDKVIAITNFTKRDLEKNFNAKNVQRIYVPVDIKKEEFIDFKKLEKKYGIEQNNYYYAICSTYPHKNLMTLLKMMEEINKYKNIPQKLIVSGVKGYQQDTLMQELKEKKLNKKVIFTGFVSNEERNTLLKNANIFLFPSIFEGVGMPPIEAMHLGKRVLTTKCASIYEVTKGKCFYVEDPHDIREWLQKIEEIQKEKEKKIDFKEYKKERITQEYLKLFNQVFK